MDYLMSLVGKDQETIVDAIKEMAENVEKVKNQENEMEELNNELENHKEEIHYLRNKVDQKRDVIEDMENELDKIEEKYKKAKNELELKDRERHALEKLISDQVDEINILRDNNQSMVSQISENVRMEKCIVVQTKVIKDLENRLNDAEKVDVTKEVDELLLEIENLQKENEEKVKLLEDLDKENQILQDNLKSEQEKKHEFQDSLEKVNDNLALNEELSLERKIHSKFPCELCGKGFDMKKDLKIHFEMSHKKQLGLRRLNEQVESLETKLLQQKYILMSSLSNLQQKDLKRKHVCQCAGVCRINHNIYNWSRPRSEPLVIKSKDVLEKQVCVEKESEPKHFQCQTCGKMFENPNHLKTHVEALHCIETCFVNPWGLNFLQ